MTEQTQVDQSTQTPTEPVATAPAAPAPSAPATVPISELLKLQDDVGRTVHGLRQEAQSYKQQLEQLRRAEEARRAKAPDLFNDPEAYTKHIESRADERVNALRNDFSRVMFEEKMATSEENSRERLGEEKFGQLMAWLDQQPDAWHAQAGRQRDPFKYAEAEFKKHNVFTKVGDDPDAFLESKFEEMARAKGWLPPADGGAPAPAPSNVTSITDARKRSVGSLNSVPAAGGKHEPAPALAGERMYGNR